MKAMGLQNNNKTIVEYTSSDESPDTKFFFDYWGDIFKSKKRADVKIIVKEGEILAHELVLARNVYFERMFEDEGFKEAKEKQVDWSHIDINFDFDIANKVIEYVYTAKVLITSESEALKLLGLADMILERPLKRKCENFLIPRIDIENVVKLLQWADKYYARKLKHAAKEFIEENCDEVIQSEDWKKFEDVTLLKEMCESLMKQISPSKRRRLE